VYGHFLELILLVEISELSIRQDITNSDRGHIESTVLFSLLLPCDRVRVYEQKVRYFGCVFIVFITFKGIEKIFGVRCYTSGTWVGGRSCNYLGMAVLAKCTTILVDAIRVTRLPFLLV
jgi:hypothetical protein